MRFKRFCDWPSFYSSRNFRKKNPQGVIIFVDFWAEKCVDREVLNSSPAVANISWRSRRTTNDEPVMWSNVKSRGRFWRCRNSKFLSVWSTGGRAVFLVEKTGLKLFRLKRHLIQRRRPKRPDCVFSARHNTSTVFGKCSSSRECPRWGYTDFQNTYILLYSSWIFTCIRSVLRLWRITVDRSPVGRFYRWDEILHNRHTYYYMPWQTVYKIKIIIILKIRAILLLLENMNNITQ